jgi:hypothetical protein
MQITDLRQERDKLLDHQKQLTLMLPAPAKEVAPPDPPIQRRSFWDRIIGK